MEDLVFELNAGTMTEVARMTPRQLAFWYGRAIARQKRLDAARKKSGGR